MSAHDHETPARDELIASIPHRPCTVRARLYPASQRPHHRPDFHRQGSPPMQETKRKIHPFPFDAAT
jgi:hypothetical protein